jgi:hypothetical protein
MGWHFFYFALFSRQPIERLGRWLLLFFIVGWNVLPTFLLIYALAVNKFVFAVFFPLFSLLGSILSFYRYAFKAVLTAHAH